MHLQGTESRLLTNRGSFPLKIHFSLKGLKFVIYVTVLFWAANVNDSS